MSLWPLLISLMAVVATSFLVLRRSLQMKVSFIFALLHFIAVGWLLLSVTKNGILVTEVGSWPAPFGITFVAEPLGVFILALISFLSLLFLVHGGFEEGIFFQPLYHSLLMGASGALLTADLFNLYVWFEVMMIAAFGLIAFRGKGFSLEAVWRYLTFSIVASLFFLAAIGLVYGQTGKLNFADLSLSRISSEGIILLFVVGLGMKAASFPMHFWMPASYPVASPITNAFLSIILTKIAVFSLYRIFGFVIAPSAFVENIFLVLGSLTMVVGVLGAYAQWEIKKLLVFHIMSQLGYMFLGLSFFSKLTIAASFLFLIHNLLSKTLLFLVAGMIERRTGTTDLKLLGSGAGKNPYLFVLFLVGALSLAGVPPLVGFSAKWLLFQEGIRADQIAFVSVGVFVSLFTLLSMIKIWIEAFWKSGESIEWRGEVSRRPVWVGTMLALLIIGFGLGSGSLFTYLAEGASIYFDPAQYSAIVLGARP